VSAAADIEAGQWRFVAIGASVGQATPDGRPAKPGRKVLTIELDMTNRTGSSRNDYADPFRLDPALAKVADRPIGYLERDRAILFNLHPDLPERVAIAWEMPADTPVPDMLPVSIYAEVYKAQNNLQGDSGWYAPHEVGTLTLPVAAATPAPDPS